MTRTSHLAFFLGISFFGLAVVMVSILHPYLAAEETALRKPLLGSIFATICVLGMIATAYPRSCFHIFGSGGKDRGFADENYNNMATEPRFQGHHPGCGGFSTHVLKIGNNSICAGCLGFLMGGLVNLIGVLIYFFVGLPLGELAIPISWIGAAEVSLGLLLPMFSLPWAPSRAAVNAFFALGVFLLMIGVDSVTRDANMGLLLILLTVFWIFTRISISRWSHERICRKCQLKNCGLRS